MTRFGYDGGATNSMPIKNIIKGSVFTCPDDGIADSISVKLGMWSDQPLWSGRVKCAIYRHSDLSLVGVTEERVIDIIDEYEAWYTFNFITKPNLIHNTEYVLVAWAENIGTDVRIRGIWLTDEPTREHYQPYAYDDFPTILSPTHGYLKHCIYCEYTITAPPPTRGILDCHAYADGYEVSALVEITETEEKFETPFMVSLDPDTYTLKAGFDTQTPTKTATIVEEETTRVDFEFTLPKTGRFGWEAIGSERMAGLSDLVLGSIFTAPENGIAESITVAFDSASNTKCALYRRSDFKLLGVTEEKLAVAGGWTTFNFPTPKPPVNAGEKYILVAWVKIGTAIYCEMYQYTTRPGYGYFKAYNDFLDPGASEFGMFSDKLCSIYCTYTPTVHRLTVKSAPITGVPVTVNDLPVGDTPIPIDVETGEYTITVPPEVEA